MAATRRTDRAAAHREPRLQRQTKRVVKGTRRAGARQLFQPSRR
jgi:hypothetical protein